MANRNRVAWGRFPPPKYVFSWDFGAPGGVRDNLNLTHSPLGLWLFGMLPEATKALAFVAEGSKGSETRGHRERTMCEIKTVAHTPLCVESVFFRGFHSFRDHPGWRGLSTPREAKVVAYPGVVIPELN